MELLRYTDYTLRVLIYLALRPDRRATVGDIAVDFRVSHNHLTKIVHRLATSGYVTTTRGKGGGMVLARDPHEIGIGEVVRFTETNLELVECLHPYCPIVAGCRLRGVFREARDAFLAALDRHTIGSIIGDGRDLNEMLKRGEELAQFAAGGPTCLGPGPVYGAGDLNDSPAAPQ